MAFILLLMPIMNSYAMTMQVSGSSNNSSVVMQTKAVTDNTSSIDLNDDCCSVEIAQDCESNDQCCSHCISFIKNSAADLAYNHYSIYSAQHYEFMLGQTSIPSVKPPRT